MYDLGDLMRKQDHLSEAQKLYNTSMGILESVLGPTHPEIAEILNSLGLAKKKEGRYEEAAEDYMRALGIVEQCFGREHPKVGMYLNNLADCYILSPLPLSLFASVLLLLALLSCFFDG